jgi:hypothetical protein
MKGNQPTYAPWQLSSSVFMILALLWLTVSSPFVYASQQIKKEQAQKMDSQDDGNPFSNTTEEKNETGATNLSEYLHEVDVLEAPSQVLVKYYKCHSCDLYVDFHPEEVAPPPKV